MRPGLTADETEVLRSLLTVGVKLSAVRERKRMLDVILTEACKLGRAEAGSLYVVEGGRLRFMAAQNDRLGSDVVEANYVGKELPIGYDSLVGFVARTGEVVNLPDAYRLPEGAPYRVNRDFDAATGYHTRTILALPLCCADGRCIGVLQLVNRLDPDANIVPFDEDAGEPIRSLASMAAVTIHNAQLAEQLKRAHLGTIIRLVSAAEFRDDDTAEHVRRVSRTSALIARGMNLPPDTVELIEAASPMHDIGKIGIPDAILLKPGKLTLEERRVMETHTTIGAKILDEPDSDLLAMGREIALSHHEHWDGTGYPNRLDAEGIPVSGRIVGLADVFDALVSKRCYKEAYPTERSLEIVRAEAGRHFDPAAVAAFEDVRDEVLANYR